MAVATQRNPLNPRDALQRRQQRQESEITGKDSAGRSRPDTVSPRVQGKNVFNLRRQQVESEEQKAKERQQRALERRLSTQGIKGGLAAQQQRLLDAESRKILASRKGEVDIQEILASERDKATKSQRDFAREERVGTQQFQSEQERLRAERAAAEAEKQREFGKGERIGTQQFQKEFQTEREQFQAAEAEKDRIVQDTYNKAQLSLREKELAQEADFFNRKEEFDKFALERGFQEAEVERAWQAQQQANQNVFEASQTVTKQKAAETLAKLENELALGRLDFAQKIEEQNQINSTKADAAYKLGVSGAPISRTQFFNMSDLERASYDAGKSGATLQEHNQQKELLINYRNAIITTLDPENPNFINALNKIMTQTGGLPQSQLLTQQQFSGLTGTKSPVQSLIQNLIPNKTQPRPTFKKLSPFAQFLQNQKQKAKPFQGLERP